MSDNGTKPILDLDALTKPLFTVRLDGKGYEFRHWGALSLRARLRVGHINERLREIEALPDEEVDAAEAEYDDLVKQALILVSSMTSEDIDGADKDKVREALTAFLGARQARQMEMAMAVANMTDRSTSENSSPGFNRATRRAARKAG